MGFAPLREMSASVCDLFAVVNYMDKITGNIDCKMASMVFSLTLTMRGCTNECVAEMCISYNIIPLR